MNDDGGAAQHATMPLGIAVARQAVGLAAATPLVAGGFMLAVWLSGVGAQWATGSTVIMKTNMALALVLAGMSLILLAQWPERRVCLGAGSAAAIVVFLIGSLTLSEHVVGWNLGIDQLVAKEPSGAAATVSPNRIGLPGSTSHTLLGMALLLLAAGRRRAVPYLGLAVILINVVPALGFLYGVSGVLTRPSMGIAWPTVLALMSLGVGLIAACPENGLMALLLRDDAGGKLLRAMLPAAILLPMGLGYLRTLGEQRGLYDAPIGRSLLVLSLMLLFSLLLWRSAGRLSSADCRQRQARETLRRSEEQYRGLFDSMNEGFAIGEPILDEQGKPIDIRFLQINPAFQRQSGLTERILGKPLKTVLPNLEQHWIDRYAEVAFTGKPAHFEAPNMDTQRHYEVYCYSPAKGQFATIFTDITGRKQRERALRESEARYRTLFSEMDEGYCIIEMLYDSNGVPNDWRYIEVNPAFERHNGLKDATGKTIRELRPDMEARWFQRYAEVDRTGRAARFQESSEAFGRWFDLYVFRVGEPEQHRIAVLFTDITARRTGEEQLMAAKQSAEHASRAKDHFLAVLSHELRTPLSPVVATLGMLQDNPRLDAEMRESLEMIHRNVLLEARLIDDLLDVTRIERGKVQLERHRVHIATIVRQAAEVCMPDIQMRKLQFTICAADGTLMVDADPGRLQQVLWNLLKNAIKFTPNGGSVTVRCREEAQQQIVVEVSDSGDGIEPHVLPRLFNAFEQGDRRATGQFGGLGLGLAISKAIAELHGGTLTAHSEGRGKGACFTLRLPAAAAEDSTAEAATAIAAATTTATTSTPEARPIRILLVEDHGDTARSMCRLLQARGHDVKIATDVASALRFAMEGTFDLMLSDLGLPDGSGVDLMRQLRSQGSRLPGIALSGYGQDLDLKQTREAGFVEHLVKPVSLPRLVEAIARAVEHSAVTTQEGTSVTP